MKVKITADSTCDLSPELLKQYDIDVLPLYIIMNGKSYRDGVEITPDDIYAYISGGGESCGTAAANVDDYIHYFKPYLKEYDAVVHFQISSEMSACYQNAVLAAAELENVYPVDSRNLSTGIGHLVLDAAVMAQQGYDGAAIKAAMDEKKERLDVSFFLDTLSYMRKGGRCSAVAALGANLLGLKPCIEVKNGKMGVGKKYRGKWEKVVGDYVRDRLTTGGEIEYDRIFITDSGCSDERFELAKQAVEQYGHFKEIYHTHAGCSVSNHCGPNTLGVLFYRKDKVR